jgi:hypothetical protein
MFRWLSRWWKAKTAEKTLVGVKVELVEFHGRWHALFRAWDRGISDYSNRLVPERVVVEGRDAADALKKAESYLLGLKVSSSGQLVFARLPDEPNPLSSCGGPISNVFVFPDGVCSVFDAQGTQLWRYQGNWDDVCDRIMRDAPVGTEFSVAFPPALRELRAAGRGWKIETRTE